MAKLQRKSAKLFAENAAAAAGGLAQFGSLAAGTPNYSTDPDVIQALAAYANGWSAAVLGTKSPALEDRNALDYLLSYQQAYIMQHGIPEWLDTETYYIGSFASVGYALYVSKTDNNIGNNPTTDSTETNWVKFPTPQEVADGLALKVNKAGDTMTGNLIMNGGTVYNRVSGTDYRMLDARDFTFKNVNAVIAQGNRAAVEGTHSLTSYLTDGKEHPCLFSVQLNLSVEGNASVALNSDILLNPACVCGTNNGFGTGGSVVIPCKESVIISMPTAAGSPNSKITLLGYW